MRIDTLILRQSVPIDDVTLVRLEERNSRLSRASGTPTPTMKHSFYVFEMFIISDAH